MSAKGPLPSANSPEARSAEVSPITHSQSRTMPDANPQAAPFDLTGKVAFVPGGYGGIGAAIAWGSAGKARK